MTSQTQITANQQNALKSTGPRSAEGKDVSRFNALKHGLDARSLVIPGEDLDELAALINDYLHQFRPNGPVERMMVDTLIRADWHLRRYDRIESGVIARMIGDGDPNAALAGLFGTAAPKSNPLPHLFRRRQTAQRDYFRALKELQRMQKERRQKEDTEESQAEPVKIGFDLSAEPIAPPAAPEAASPALKIAS
jgi:hypothetical protein